MIKRKPRLLFVSEFSQMSTGFAGICNEMVSRLHQSGKIEVAEFGSYAKSSDPRARELPWKFYGAIPEDSDQFTKQRENGSHFYRTYGQFGAAMFEQVCLDFLPDAIFDIRDRWMCCWQLQSPFRDNVKLIWCPTIDGEPQRLEWLDEYGQIDSLFTYTKYGKDTLEREAPELNVLDLLRPGVNQDIYKPIDRNECRKHLGLPLDAKIVISVMRNQKRKLFPDLIDAFGKFLKKCVENNNQELFDKAILYLHTSLIDVGYDIQKFAIDSGLGNKIYMTYVCQNCSQMFASKIQTEVSACPRCQQLAAITPNSNKGISEEQLAIVYNAANVYFQPSICIEENQEVQTKNGWVAIKDVKIGDQVLTHHNKYQNVLDKFDNGNQNTVKISVFSDDETLLATPSHKMYGIKNNGDEHGSLREKVGTALRRNKDLSPDFLKISELSNGDLLFLPIDQSIEDKSFVDLAEYANDIDTVGEKTIKTSHGGYEYSRYMELDEDFCKFIGLFAADGSWNKASACAKITCHDEEAENINLCKRIHDRLANKPYSIHKYKDRNALDVLINCTIFWRFCKENFGKHTWKQLPDWVDKLSPQKQMWILQGYIMGDGHKLKNKDGMLTVTISQKLCRQIKNILRRLRLNHSCRIVNKQCNDNKNRQPQYTINIYHDINKEISLIRQSARSFYYKDYYVLQIKNIENDGTHRVYDLSVENDHSYVTRLGSAHNCEGLAMPPLEARACEIPMYCTDYSATADQAHEPGGNPIKVERMFWETVIETEQSRALPDINDMAKQMYSFFQQSDETIATIGRQAREYVAANYSFDRATKILEDTILAQDFPDHSLTWKNPTIKRCPMNTGVPADLSNSEFVDWCIINILGQPNKIHTYWRDEIVKSLNLNSMTMEGTRQAVEFRREQCYNMFMNKAQEYNYFEDVRYHKFFGNHKKQIFEVV